MLVLVRLLTFGMPELLGEVLWKKTCKIFTRGKKNLPDFKRILPFNNDTAGNSSTHQILAGEFH